MLILTRRPAESIKIGNDIEIIVLSIGNNQARIGIRAPREISVYREEIYERINQSFSLSSPKE